MTILYLAGGSSERLAVCRPLVDHLLSAGVPVAYDWTRDPGWDTPGGPSAADLLASARRDLEAVRRCHVLWYVAPAAPSEGSAAELGAALAIGRRVVVSGPHARAAFRMFPLLATESYGTHEEALAALVEEGRKERAAVEVVDRADIAKRLEARIKALPALRANGWQIVGGVEKSDVLRIIAAALLGGAS